MPRVKSYMNPNIPRPKPGDSKGEGRITKPMEPIKRREITPPKGEKRPIRKPIKPINKPGVNPTKKKTGPRRPNRNDIIRNRLRPVGTK